MSNNLRLVSSAKSLRSQFKGISNGSSNNLNSSSSASIYTAGSSVSQSRSLDPSASVPGSVSRQGSLQQSTSNGNLRRSKSVQKKTLIAKVFADEAAPQESRPDLSMEMTLLVVKRCVKEIRERGNHPGDLLKCLLFPSLFLNRQATFSFWKSRTHDKGHPSPGADGTEQKSDHGYDQHDLG